VQSVLAWRFVRALLRGMGVNPILAGKLFSSTSLLFIKQFLPPY
jgi:hypothetical protein